jgi:aspartyl protease family protein
MGRALIAAALAAGALLAAAASAQTVSMSGALGDNKALLMINGAPRTVTVGSTVQGVRLISMSGGEAVVEVGGERQQLRLGGVQVSLGAAPVEGGGSRIVLPVGPGGHFYSQGSINGKAVVFVVDTGATTVSISQSEADAIGLKYRDGQRGMVNTANGSVPAYRLTLNSVRIGDVQVFNVEAVVLPASMSQVLLGNSFLSRFQMKRDNDTMTLDKKP